MLDNVLPYKCPICGQRYGIEIECYGGYDRITYSGQFITHEKVMAVLIEKVKDAE